MSKSENKRLSIVARPASGFRRAGFNFTHTPTVINTADLDDAQLALLKNEPNLVVTELSEGQEVSEDANKHVAAALTEQLDQAQKALELAGKENAELKEDNEKIAKLLKSEQADNDALKEELEKVKAELSAAKKTVTEETGKKKSQK